MQNLIVQSTYTDRPDEMILGQRMEAYGPELKVAKVARGLVKAGYGLFRAGVAYGQAGGHGGPISTGSGFNQPSPSLAVDVDAIVDGLASATTEQVLEAGDLDGIVGAAVMAPGRRLTFTFNTEADWIASNITVAGEDLYGRIVTETVAVPVGGNATVTTDQYFTKVTQITVPAQDGTAGSLDVGIEAITLALADYLGVVMRIPVKTSLSVNSLYGELSNYSLGAEGHYFNGETVDVMEVGAICIYSEEAVADGDPVYVRVAAGAGGSTLGAYRNDADSGSCVLTTGKFQRNSSGAGPAWARFR